MLAAGGIINADAETERYFVKNTAFCFYVKIISQFVSENKIN
jgi:hypothetical protein